MKKFSLMIIFMMALAIFTAVPVLAQTITVTQTTGTEFSPIGGPDDDASNPNHDDDAQIRPVSMNFDIESDAVATVSVVITPALSKYTLVSSTPGAFGNLEALESLYNAESQVFYETIADINLVVGANPVTLRTMIPANLDSADQTTFNAKGFEVLTVTIKDTTTSDVYDTFDVYIQRVNALEVKNLKAKVNDRRTESLDEDGGDPIENVKPGDSIDVTLEIENILDDKENIDVENIDAELTCTNSGDFDVEDETLDFGDLGPETEDEDIYQIIVEDDADDRDSNCDIEITGKDENGAFHGIATDFNIEVTRESHDIVVRKPVGFTPQAITCDLNNLEVNIDFVNLGKRDEDDVAIELSSSTLEFVERASSIELNTDDETSESFLVPITHPISTTPVAFTVKTFYDNTRISNTETFLVENTCVDTVSPTTPSTPGEPTGSAPSGTIIIDNDFVEAGKGASVSVGVQVTNNENTAVDFTVSVVNVDEFAQAAADKRLTLQPGQTTTVFLNLRVNEDIEDGMYTGSIELLADGRTVETQQFTVDVAGKKESTGQAFDFSGNGGTIFWVIINIILIIIAIFFIRLIFTSGKKKSKQSKKMADYQARAKGRR